MLVGECSGLPGGVDDQQVSVFADLQRPVRVAASQGVRRVDGGRRQSLGHGHPHVDAGQVHDNWLKTGRREELSPSCKHSPSAQHALPVTLTMEQQ